MVRTDQLGTTTEVASYLKVPDRTLEMWRYRGTGPRYLKLAGGRVRYRWADVEKWLEQQSSVPA